MYLSLSIYIYIYTHIHLSLYVCIYIYMHMLIFVHSIARMVDNSCHSMLTMGLLDGLVWVHHATTSFHTCYDHVFNSCSTLFPLFGFTPVSSLAALAATNEDKVPNALSSGKADDMFECYVYASYSDVLQVRVRMLVYTCSYKEREAERFYL